MAVSVILGTGVGRRKSGGGPPHSKTLARWPNTTGTARSVLECSSPLELSPMAIQLDRSASQLDYGGFSQPWHRCRPPEKRRRAAALQNAGALAKHHRTARSVLECSSPLELSPMAIQLDRSASQLDYGGFGHPSHRCRPPEKRRRAAALQDAGALAKRHRTARSVLECSSPLELSPMAFQLDRSASQLDYGGFSHPWHRCRPPEKRRRAAALQNAGALAKRHRTARSVLECSSPLELSPMAFQLDRSPIQLERSSIQLERSSIQLERSSIQLD